ncbi:uncharacterized protein LOC114536061 [Dendronephthya gigantea]|uniref:uncharacterized protein LOC114536061 n=1 Tax=Dendronephthya gigantea TaxID=151771 RepID=UPI00106D2C5E|nr:uncharacterized protein LOC114536061 [Dendronephthya gigantea]
MAAKKSGRRCQGELNFMSASFNPLLALYSKNLQPPFPNARILNTICEYAKSLKEVKNEEKDNDVANRLKNIAENRLAKLRNRKRDPSKLEHLMKVKSQTDGIVEKVTMLEKAKRKGKQMNVLERMEVKYKEGPLSVLYNCIEKKAKLKVWTRRLNGLRGVCVGYLVAFDKHMNLAMMDVDEMFAIEEEVIVDPAEEMMESLERIERKKEKKRKWRRKKRETLRQRGKGEGEVLSVEAIKEESGNVNFEGKECFSSNTDGVSFDNKTTAENCSTPSLDSNTDDNEDSGRNDNLGEETPSSTCEVDLGERKETATNMDVSNSDLSKDNESCKIVTKDIDFVDSNLEQKQDELCQIEIVQNDNREALENDFQRSEPSDIAIKKDSIDKKETGDLPSNSLEKYTPLTRSPSRDMASKTDQKRKAFCRGVGEMELAKKSSDSGEISAREMESHGDVSLTETTSNQVTIFNILDEVQGTETELKKAETLLPNEQNNDSYECKASAVLQSNVLAMEFDEGSQDSTVFDETVSRESSALLETVTLHHTITYGMEESVGAMKHLPCEEVVGDYRESDNEADGGGGDNLEVGTVMSMVAEEEGNNSQVGFSYDDDTEDNKEIVDSSMPEDSEGTVENNEETVADDEGTVEDNEGTVMDNEGMVKDEGRVEDNEGTVENNEGMVKDEGTVEDKERMVEDKKDEYVDKRVEETNGEEKQPKIIEEELIKSTHDSQSCNVLEITKQENIKETEEELRIKDESHDDCSDFKEDENRMEQRFPDDAEAKSTIGSESGDIIDTRRGENVDEKEEGELSSSDVEKSVEEECKPFRQDIKKLENVSALKSHEKSSTRQKTNNNSSKTTSEIKSNESTRRRRSVSSTKESSCETNSKRTEKAVNEKRKSNIPKERRQSLVDKDGRSSKKDEDKNTVKSKIIDLSKGRRSERRSSGNDERRSSVPGLDSSTSTKHVGSKEPIKRWTRSSRKDKHNEKNEAEKKVDNDSSLRRGRSDTREKQRNPTEKVKGSGEKASKEKTNLRKVKSSSESNLSSKKKLDETQGTQVKFARRSSQGLSRNEDLCKSNTRRSGAESSKERFSSTRKDAKSKGEETQSRGKNSKTIRKDSETNSKGDNKKGKSEKSTKSKTSSDTMKMENISGQKEEEKKDSKGNSKVENKTSKKNETGKKSELKRENSGLKSREKSSNDRNDSSLKKGDFNKCVKTGDKSCAPRKDSLKDETRSKSDVEDTKTKSSSQNDKHARHSGSTRIVKETGKNVKSSSKDGEECVDTTKCLRSSSAKKLCELKEGSLKKDVNNSVKRKDGSSKTTDSCKTTKAQTKVFSEEKSSAKKKQNVDDKCRSKLERKEAGETVSQERERSTQSKTSKEKAEESPPSASSKLNDSSKQDHKENAERFSGKRKREITPERKQKTAKLDTKINAVKTKQAKLPGNVVTVRILKVDRVRGKALVLKNRHINQLFIRGDNIIMVAYDNLEATEVKI